MPTNERVRPHIRLWRLFRDHAGTLAIAALIALLQFSGDGASIPEKWRRRETSALMLEILAIALLLAKVKAISRRWTWWQRVSNHSLTYFNAAMGSLPFVGAWLFFAYWRFFLQDPEEETKWEWRAAGRDCLWFVLENIVVAKFLDMLQESGREAQEVNTATVFVSQGFKISDPLQLKKHQQEGQNRFRGAFERSDSLRQQDKDLSERQRQLAMAHRLADKFDAFRAPAPSAVAIAAARDDSGGFGGAGSGSVGGGSGSGSGSSGVSLKRSPAKVYREEADVVARIREVEAELELRQREGQLTPTVIEDVPRLSEALRRARKQKQWLEARVEGEVKRTVELLEEGMELDVRKINRQDYRDLTRRFERTRKMDARNQLKDDEKKVLEKAERRMPRLGDMLATTRLNVSLNFVENENENEFGDGDGNHGEGYDDSEDDEERAQGSSGSRGGRRLAVRTIIDVPFEQVFPNSSTRELWEDAREWARQDGGLIKFESGDGKKGGGGGGGGKARADRRHSGATMTDRLLAAEQSPLPSSSSSSATLSSATVMRRRTSEDPSSGNGRVDDSWEERWRETVWRTSQHRLASLISTTANAGHFAAQASASVEDSFSSSSSSSSPSSSFSFLPGGGSVSSHEFVFGVAFEGLGAKDHADIQKLEEKIPKLEAEIEELLETDEDSGLVVPPQNPSTRSKLKRKMEAEALAKEELRHLKVRGRPSQYSVLVAERGALQRHFSSGAPPPANAAEKGSFLNGRWKLMQHLAKAYKHEDEGRDRIAKNKLLMLHKDQGPLVLSLPAASNASSLQRSLSPSSSSSSSSSLLLSSSVSGKRQRLSRTNAAAASSTGAMAVDDDDDKEEEEEEEEEAPRTTRSAKKKSSQQQQQQQSREKQQTRGGGGGGGGKSKLQLLSPPATVTASRRLQ